MGTIALVNLLPGIVIYPDQCVGQKRRAATFLSVYRDSCSDDASCAETVSGFCLQRRTCHEFPGRLYFAGQKTREDPPVPRRYEPAPESRKQDSVLQEEMVERIAASIRQTAATGSHFSKMLSPEEEEIMREIIREFMD